jgi:hypothetical protein
MLKFYQTRNLGLLRMVFQLMCMLIYLQDSPIQYTKLTIVSLHNVVLTVHSTHRRVISFSISGHFVYAI